MSKLMAGKRGLIMGLANDKSLAWGIAQKLAEHGAELAFSYQGDALAKRVVPLAEQLGATTVVLNGPDLVSSALHYAGQNNVTQIVIGKGPDSRLREIFGLSLAAELLRAARGVAIHVVTEAGSGTAAVRRRWAWRGLKRTSSAPKREAS